MKMRILSLVALLTLASPTAMARLGTVDGIAFVINDDIITLADWEREMQLARDEMSYIPPNQRLSGQELEEYVTKVIITTKYQDLFAKQAGLHVQNNEVDAAIADIAARNGTDIATLREYIQYQGMDYNQYRENIRGQMLAARLQNEIVQSTSFSENEIDLYMKTAEFQKLKERMMSANVSQHKVSHILIAVNKDTSETKALQEANRLRERIISGDASFEDIARANSQDPLSAAEDGSLGWVGLGQLAPEFEKAMVRLSKEELSQPVRTAYGYHLIKVNDRRTGFQDEEVIRNVAREYYFRKKATTFDEWLNRMLSDVYVEKRVGTQ